EYDTIMTTYFYDNENRKIKETVVGEFNPFNGKSNGFTNLVTYTYLNDSIVIKRYEGNGLAARGSGMDSIINNKDKIIRLFNRENDLKILYSYNDKYQLVSKIQTSIAEPDLIFQYNKYLY